MNKAMKNTILTTELRVKIDCKQWYDIFPVHTLDRYEAPILFLLNIIQYEDLAFFFFLVVMTYIRLENAVRILLIHC